MKKRLSALLLALAMILALAACGNTEESAEDEETPVQEETAQPEDETAGGEEADDEEEPADEAEEPADEAPAEEGNTASDPGSGSTKPAGEQSTAGQKPAEEQKPAQKPQEPAKDETVSQPTQPETPAEPAAEGVDLAAFAASVTADQETWPGMMAMEGEALEAFYPGLSAIATKQCVVQMAMISASGDELALVEVENSADVQAVKDIFQARIDYQVGDGETPGGAWYPAPTEMWKSESRIVSSGNFVMLVAHNGADSVVEQFNALFA